MNKKFIISFIIMFIVIFATNKFWYVYLDTQITFKIFSTGKYHLDVQLDKSDLNFNNYQSNDDYFNLNKSSDINIFVPRAKTIKAVKLFMLNPSPDTSYLITPFELKYPNYKLNDLTKYVAYNADLKIQDNKLLVTPYNYKHFAITYNQTLDNLNAEVNINYLNLFLIAFATFLVSFILLYNLKRIINLFILWFKKLVVFIEYCDKNSIIFFNLASVLNIFLFSVFACSFLGFIVGVSISKIYFIISLIIAVGSIILLNKKDNISKNNLIIQLIVLFLTVLIALVLALYYLDASWDGRAYHQGAIIVLKSGWNPIYDVLSHGIIKHHYIWIENYTKFVEILAANFLLIFNKIELGKIVNYIFAFITFFTALFAFSTFKNVKPIWKFILAVLLLLNPVSIYQIATYYNDFLVYYLFITIILITIAKEKTSSNNIFNLLIIMNLTILANIKLGGLFLALLYLISYFIYKLFSKNLKDVAIISLFTICLILLSGINPYFTNIKQDRNPFYPIVGENKVDIMTSTMPEQFENKNSIYKIFYSTFGVTENNLKETHKSVKLRLPFLLKNEATFADPDMRINGFGYFWSGILILTLLFFLVTKNDKTEDKKLYYFIMSLIIGSILFNPEAWWARYVPQFWALPIFIILYRLNNKMILTNKKIFAFLIITIIIVNSIIVEQQNIKHRLLCKNNLTKELKYIKEHKNNNILIYQSEDIYDSSFYQRLDEYGINYKLVDENYYKKNKKVFNQPLYIMKNQIKWSIMSDD